MSFPEIRGQEVAGTRTYTIDSTEYRNPYFWPFSKKSIWNTPIGSDAGYVHARLSPVNGLCPRAEETVIILTPHEKPMAIYYNHGLVSGQGLCVKSDHKVLLEAPVPDHFFAAPHVHSGMAAAVLGQDKSTLHQIQPFTRCHGYEYATTFQAYPDVDLYGSGIRGAHPGSGLSSIGGTIRMGELIPGGRIRHALKCALSGKTSLYYSEETKGYRWPAIKAGKDAALTYGIDGDPEVECRMGSLLAIPAWMEVDSMGFQTEPGKIIARACQEYGMYVVDDTDTLEEYRICTEMGPDGSVEEDFSETWGYHFNQADTTHPWYQDIRLLFQNLYVVFNNYADNVGGGGVPVVPEAPDFLKTYYLTIGVEGAEGAEVNPAGTIKVIHGEETSVKVATIPEGYRFKYWTLVDGIATLRNSDSTNAVAILSEGDATVHAVFSDMSYELITSVKGNGILQVDPDKKLYDLDEVVGLSAIPDTGWAFTGWSGDLEGDENPVHVIMDRDYNVIAHFDSAMTSLHKNMPKTRFEQGRSVRVELSQRTDLPGLYYWIADGVILESIRIYTLQGTLLWEKNVFLSGSGGLAMEGLDTGIYIVQCDLEDGEREHKVLFIH